VTPLLERQSCRAHEASSDHVCVPAAEAAEYPRDVAPGPCCHSDSFLSFHIPERSRAMRIDLNLLRSLPGSPPRKLSPSLDRSKENGTQSIDNGPPLKLRILSTLVLSRFDSNDKKWPGTLLIAVASDVGRLSPVIG